MYLLAASDLGFEQNNYENLFSVCQLGTVETHVQSISVIATIDMPRDLSFDMPRDPSSGQILYIQVHAYKVKDTPANSLIAKYFDLGESCLFS